ncbi:MAG: SpoIIE family protein phosphatase [Vicinamibacteria bacterium]|nr:SpoIIE family protein phosphatase [Vicinamibacteria bacterium]
MIVDLQQPGSPIIYVNEGFERLTGYSRAEAMGLNCRFLQGDKTDPEAREEIRRAIHERTPCVVEILNYRKDGAPFWNRLSLTPVRNSRGEATHYIGIQSDVSVRRYAEDALRAANHELGLAAERLRLDLDAAAHIQRALLPETVPRLTAASFAWSLRPSERLAGDLLGIIPLDEECVGLYVADVSGHGVPAALLAVTLSHWLEPARGQSPLLNADDGNATHSRITPPATVAERLSAQFPFDVRTAQYFTMIYGVLDTRSRLFRFVCAGHPAPIHVPRDGAARWLDAGGFPVGLVPNPSYDEERIALAEGDRVFLFSDGLVEMENAAGEAFGIGRFMDAFVNTRGSPLDATLDSVMATVESWSGGSGRRDDLSIVAFEMSK